MLSQSVTSGVIVERVGDDLMVIVPGSTKVVSLSARAAEVLLEVQAGRKVDSADPALRDLVDQGIVSAPGLSRRGLIKAGAIGVGAGIAVLAMPSAAYAASTGNQLDLILGWSNTNLDRFQFYAVPPGFDEDESYVVAVQSATATFSDDNTAVTSFEYQGPNSDGLNFFLIASAQNQPPLSAEVVFTANGVPLVARYTAP